MNHSQKAKQNNLLQTSDGNYGTTYSYKGEDGKPIEDMLKTEFYETVKSRLSAGDTIQVMEFEKDRIVATTRLIVVHKTKDNHQTLDIRPYDNSEIIRYEEREYPKPEEEFVVVPQERFVQGDGQVEYDRSKKEYTVKTGEGIVLKTEKKALAHAVARGDAPIPSE